MFNVVVVLHVLPVDIQTGKHTFVVEWRKWGSYVGAWRNSPSFLDGFAMSRSVAAMGERFDLASQHILTPVVLRDPKDEWQTVGGKQLDFRLHASATVLFTYGLPVTQVTTLWVLVIVIPMYQVWCCLGCLW